MKNQNTNWSRRVSYATAGTAFFGLLQLFNAASPAQSLGYSLDAAAFLLLSLYLLFRPGWTVLFVAVVLVGVCSVIVRADGPDRSPTAIKLCLLELAIALIAVSVTEWQARHRAKA